MSQKARTPLILVANEGGGNGGSILEFPETANGNVAPTVGISDHNGGPRGIAVDSKRFAVTDGPTGRGGGDPGVEAFALDSNGNSGPVKVIECFPTFADTDGVAFDSAEDLYVSDQAQIEIFKPDAINCAKPIGTISEAGAALPSTPTTFFTSPTKREDRSISLPRGQSPVERSRRQQYWTFRSGQRRARRLTQRLRLRLRNAINQRVCWRSDRQRRTSSRDRRVQNRI